MAIYNVKAGPKKNTGGTILGAGNSDPSVANNLSLENSIPEGHVGNKVVLAVSPTESGNLGTAKVISGGIFANPGKEDFTGMIIGDKIAGIPSNVLKYAQSTNYPLLNYGKGYHRLNITSWNYATGKATYGVNAGDLVTYWAPMDNSTINMEQYPTDLIPGKFTYMTPNLTPVMDDYPPRT